MFLQLAHTKLHVFQISKKMALECYKMTKQFPTDERFAMVQQIRRAALSIHLNIAEGCSRKSKQERTRYFEIARGSLIEIDTAIGFAFNLSYVLFESLQPLGEYILESFKLLTGMIRAGNFHQ